MPPTPKAGTEYTILWGAANDGIWNEIGTVVAASESAAKNKGLATWKPEGGWVVAVPTRSWKPENKTPELRFR